MTTSDGRLSSIRFYEPNSGDETKANVKAQDQVLKKMDFLLLIHPNVNGPKRVSSSKRLRCKARVFIKASFTASSSFPFPFKRCGLLYSIRPGTYISLTIKAQEYCTLSPTISGCCSPYPRSRAQGHHLVAGRDTFIRQRRDRRAGIGS